MQTSVSQTRFSDRERIASWLSLLVGLVFLLILMGGTVRLTGSGLSIPEWPIINGSLLPPITEKGWQDVYETFHRDIRGLKAGQDGAWLTMSRFKREFAIEYTHRLLASVTGLIFLALCVQSFRLPSVRRRIGGQMASAAGLLLAQAVLGGIVVRTVGVGEDVKGWLVTTHLCTAFIFMSLLLWMAMRLLAGENPPTPVRTSIGRWAWSSLAVVFLQTATGGLVAGTKAWQVCSTFPKMADRWIPPAEALWLDQYTHGLWNLLENQVLLQFMHRTWALAVLVAVMGLILKALRAPLSFRARFAVRALASVLAFQVMLGILNILNQVPFLIGLAHLATGTFLFCLLVLITFEVHHSADLARWEEEGAIPAEEPALAS